MQPIQYFYKPSQVSPIASFTVITSLHNFLLNQLWKGLKVMSTCTKKSVAKPGFNPHPSDRLQTCVLHAKPTARKNHAWLLSLYQAKAERQSLCHITSRLVGATASHCLMFLTPCSGFLQRNKSEFTRYLLKAVLTSKNVSHSCACGLTHQGIHVAS